MDATLEELGSGDTLAATHAAGASSGAARGLERGVLINRYVVLSKLGAGGMGVVLAAYDPELDRKVALKLLKPHGGDQAAARARLQREAQALAKLDHPNVVGVHDVGVHSEQLFVAMDFVAGQTLGAWMREGPRPWPEVVRKFVDAGRGLVAAHEAGLIHRDFKPENVMLGDDGRVRVMDFGLARTIDEHPVEPSNEPHTPLLRQTLTQAGALVGTLAYMAPEQFAGQPADVRSDQFSFCVSLYEALHGQRPFTAGALAELIDALENERVRPPPRGSKVPSWLHAIVVRGLARDPDRRWPSMAALLDALLDDPSIRRRRRWAGLGLAGLLAGGAWGIVAQLRSEARICEGMDEKLAGVWDATRRAEVETAMLGTKLGYAAETWARVEPHLDAYADAWVAAREHACLASHRGEQSGTLLDLRMACLDERLDHLRATIDELAGADPEVVKKAVPAVLELPSLDRCADADALTAQIPPPDDPAVAEQVRAQDAKLIEAAAKQRAGRYAEGLALTDEVVAEAQTLGYPPLLARAALQQGELHKRVGDYQAAVAAFERAYDIAVGQRMTDQAASASAWLMYVLGYDLARHDEGHRWATHAEPWSRAVGTDEARVAYLASAGALADAEGEYQQAHDHQARALALLEQQLGAEHPRIASALNNLGIVVDLQGEHDQARGYYERALAIYIATLGPEHPLVASTLTNIGAAAYGQGEYDDARQHLERALTISERSLGPEHPEVANALNNLGALEYMLGNYAAARRHLERALAIQATIHGLEHPLVANTLNNLGDIAFDEGRNADARGYHERALVIREQVQGSGHPDVASTLDKLGNIARDEGDFAGSRELHQRALAIWEGSVGLDHPNVAFTSTGLGEALLGAGEPAAAIAPLERALAIRSASEVDPNLLAETRFALARALWEAPSEHGRDRVRAIELAESAQTAWTEHGEAWASNREAVTQWLASRRATP